MIKNTFSLLERVGLKKERSIWSQGIADWNDFIFKDNIKGLSKKTKLYFDRKLIEAKQKLSAEDSTYFFDILPQTEHWRLYNEFRDQAIFIDIETNIVSKDVYPTVISLYDGYDVKTMVRGINMDKNLLEQELSKAKLLVSFNGSILDIPFLKKFFQLNIEIPHFDLRFALQRLGITGGLKDIEKKFNIERRNIIQDLRNGDPYLLWKTFLATGDQSYLNLLVEYNQEDVINLKTIADKIIRSLEIQIKTT